MFTEISVKPCTNVCQALSTMAYLIWLHWWLIPFSWLVNSGTNIYNECENQASYPLEPTIPPHVTAFFIPIRIWIGYNLDSTKAKCPKVKRNKDNKWGNEIKGLKVSILCIFFLSPWDAHFLYCLYSLPD